ncbi:MAG: hypothetical protein ACOZCL_03750 [Bacillota bacterium]
MGSIGLVLLIVTVIAFIQALLSTRYNKLLGLIVPGINILCSIIISLLFTDIFTALLGLVVTAIPTIIWLSIYRVCRRKLGKKTVTEINRMKINDL